MRYTDVDLNGASVLVTGGAGFIGANLALHLQRHYPRCRILVFDAFTLGHFKNLAGFTGECVAGDVSRPDDLVRLRQHRFDYIFHQAAISDTTVTDQRRMVEINTNAFGSLLQLAAETKATVVYASSAGVYGNSPAPNRVGEGETPENVYGFSKLMMDHLARQFAEKHDLRIVGLRYFNVYGPGEAYKGATASMVSQLARQVLAGECPRLFRSGEQRRDFVFIEDVMQANLRAIAARRSGVYNIGSGRARSFNELADILRSALGSDLPTEYIDNPYAFYQNHTEADIVPAQEDLGYQPRYSLEAGVEAYLAKLRARM